MLSSYQIHFEQIADDLAQDGLAIIDAFLIKEEVEGILSLDEFKNHLLQFKKAGVGASHNLTIKEGIRGDYIRWVDNSNIHPNLEAYFLKLKALISYLNQNLFLSLKDIEMHLTRYPIGSFYKKHKDQFRSEDHRKISIILYLNNDWKEEQGGQLRIHTEEKICDIFPIAGRLVCMRSDLIEHEVLPATRERLSVTGWMLDQFIQMK